ncbi:MAG: hypothetical protein ACREH9_08690 [Pseudomonadota bacterium]
MPDEPERVVLQHLRSLGERVDTLHERQLEMVPRIGSLETQMAGMSVRIDRIDMRLDRIER